MSEAPEQEPIPVCQWEFDHFSTEHWAEVEKGNVDATKSWVELADTEQGQQVTIFANKQAKLRIFADRDQWGTWITFQIGEQCITIAQEDGTKSFIDALIASLTKLKGITDCDTKPPVVTELNQSERTD